MVKNESIFLQIPVTFFVKERSNYKTTEGLTKLCLTSSSHSCPQTVTQKPYLYRIPLLYLVTFVGN